MSLGDKCHYSTERNQTVTAAVVTDLKGEILYSNVGNWVLSGVKTYETRFWSSGQATVILTGKIDEQQELIEDYDHKLSTETQFCIWLGWIDRPRPIKKKDLEEGRLVRTFIGVVDTLQFTGTGEGGTTIKVVARDRMKWLMDSEIYYTMSDSVMQKTSKESEFNRSQIILDIAKRAVGVFATGENDQKCDTSGCGVDILKSNDYTIDIETLGELPPADVWYKEHKPLAGTTRTINLEVPENPEFRIYTSRAIANLNEQANFIINQQYPIEIIRFLSFQEVYPTEVFMNPKDGHIYYVPRAVDSSAFENPDSTDQTQDDTATGDNRRFYRTYYYKKARKDVEVDINQMAINFREERTTVATKTNFLVQNSGSGAGGGISFQYHLKAMPYELANKKFACKFKRIQDPTIENFAEAAVVSIAAARRTAKETRAGMLTVQGDPSFSAGEVVQVFGSPFLKNGGLDKGKSDLSKFFQYQGGWNNKIKEYARIAEEGLTFTNQRGRDVQTTDIVELPEGDRGVRFVTPDKNDPSDYLCEAISRIEGISDDQYSEEQTNMDTFAREPQTIFRVEAVVHQYNIGSRGFTTELALVSPF